LPTYINACIKKPWTKKNKWILGTYLQYIPRYVVANVTKYQQIISGFLIISMCRKRYNWNCYTYVFLDQPLVHAANNK
jgi:hypothetical protein